MTEPHSPTDPADEPLTDDEDRILDAVDAVTPDAPEAAGATAFEHGSDDPVAAQRVARAAVGARVEVPALARERAIKAALAARHRPTDDSGADDGSPVSLSEQRQARRRSQWLGPIAGTAAAVLVVLVGVFVASRSGSMDTAATSTGAAQDAGSTIAEAPVSQEMGGSAAGVDLGTAATEEQLMAKAGSVFGSAATSNAANDKAMPAPTGSAPGVDSTRTNDLSGGATYSVSTCELGARSAIPPPGTQPILTTGTVVYQGTPAWVYVFGPAPGTTASQLVAVAGGDCRLLVSAPL